MIERAGGDQPMRMNEIEFPDAQPPIDGYAPGGFRVAGRFHDGPILLSPAGLQAWSGGAALDPAAVDAILALADQVDVVVIGMGAELRLLPEAVQARFDAAGLGVEPMSTPSACRSYNVLLSEGRRAAAALTPVS